ncbi:hypothetical protein C0995_009057 [Termitomyces sp. Mi166|nr:hypothetical protein C0995_009057 [Termitomyces sp. Mi166\
MDKVLLRFGLSTSSQVPVDVKTNVAPTLSSASAKKFGLENALYFCTPFRDLMLQSPVTTPPPQVPPVSPVISTMPLVPNRRKPEPKPSASTASELPLVALIPSSPSTLFSALRSLFLHISTHPQERGIVSPRVFIEKLKEVNRVFDTTTHQDAHEFLNYLLNKIVEEVEEERKTQDALEDWLFKVSSRDEAFLDLSIDIEQNSSVTACLRQFSASEMLCHKNKFFCDSCCDLQEAEKRMKIKRLPKVLALHLKRFKYQEESQRYVKLAYRVAFPFELRLFNTIDDMEDADRLYHLFGIVVHIGNGPHHGHYVSIIKTLGAWLLFDDENVSPIAESEIPKYFGDSAPSAGCAYVLYYQAADIDMGKLGLRPDQTEEFRSTTAAEQLPPICPPGLTIAPIPTPSSSSSSLETGQPLFSRSQPSAFTPSAPSFTSLGHHAFPPAPPLTGSLSSPISVPSTVDSNVPTSSAVGSGGGPSTMTATGTPLVRGASLPAVPLMPTRVLIDGTEEGPASPTRQQSTMSVGTHSRPGTSWSHKYVGTPRALPILPRPMTSGGDAEGVREKEGGWAKWFGGGGRSAEPTMAVNGVADGAAVGSGGPEDGESSVVGEVDSNTSGHSNGAPNGSAMTGLKEKGKGKGPGHWFPKRKSFRIGGEKTPKSAITPVAEASPDAMTRLRTSLQLPQRRASDSGDGQSTIPPPLTAVRSTPAVYQQTPASSSTSKHQSPVSTTLDKEGSNSYLHPHDHILVNGEISPTPSSDSSFESGGPSIGAQTATVSLVPPSTHHTSNLITNHQHSAQNGHQQPMQLLTPFLAPRMYTSVSTPPTAPPSSILLTTPMSPYSRTRSYPEPPLMPDAPSTPERKQSLGSFQVLRRKEKEEEEGWDAVASRPSTTGSEAGRGWEMPLPPPPVPIPSPSVELRTHQYHLQPHQQQQGSMLGDLEADEPAKEAPGLASFGSANTSTGSSGGVGNAGFKKATRKLSLTAPRLGFGKREKEKEKMREKAVPGSFMRV